MKNIKMDFLSINSVFSTINSFLYPVFKYPCLKDEKHFFQIQKIKCPKSKTDYFILGWIRLFLFFVPIGYTFFILDPSSTDH